MYVLKFWPNSYVHVQKKQDRVNVPRFIKKNIQIYFTFNVCSTIEQYILVSQRCINNSLRKTHYIKGNILFLKDFSLQMQIIFIIFRYGIK